MQTLVKPRLGVTRDMGHRPQAVHRGRACKPGSAAIARRIPAPARPQARAALIPRAEVGPARRAPVEARAPRLPVLWGELPARAPWAVPARAVAAQAVAQQLRAHLAFP